MHLLWYFGCGAIHGGNGSLVHRIWRHVRISGFRFTWSSVRYQRKTEDMSWHGFGMEDMSFS